MMNWLWGMLVGAGILGFAIKGDPVGAAEAMTAGAGAAAELCLSMCAPFMLWMGLMNVARAAGLVDKLSRLTEPLLRWLMPDSPGAIAPVTLNLGANFFGLGGAATPFGLEAMKEFQKVNPHKERASDDMCMFIALNASAVELLPTGVIALRTAAGSADPYGIVVPTFIASAVSALCAVGVCLVFSRRRR